MPAEEEKDEESSSREVMTDVIEWWCHTFICQTDPSKWDPLESFLPHVMESFLPHVMPIENHGSFATRLRACAVWEAVLSNLDLGTGDFSILQDKLILLAKDFGKDKEPTYVQSLNLVKVHVQLVTLYQGLVKNGDDDGDEDHPIDPQTLFDTFQTEIQNIFGGAAHVPESFGRILTATKTVDDNTDYHSIQQRIEQLVGEEEGTYSYSKLQSAVQFLLLDWCDMALGTPELVRLGYRGAISNIRNPGRPNNGDPKQGETVAAGTRSKDKSVGRRAKKASKDGDDCVPSEEEKDDDDSEVTDFLPRGGNSSDVENEQANSRSKKRPRSLTIPRRRVIQPKKRSKSSFGGQQNTSIWDDSSSSDDGNDGFNFEVQRQAAKERRNPSPDRRKGFARAVVNLSGGGSFRRRKRWTEEETKGGLKGNYI